MPIGTDEDGRDDNEGPHCRNCHIGANNCYVCHSDSVGKYTDPTMGLNKTNPSAAYTATTTAQVTNQTNYASQTFIRQSAVAGTLDDPCLDGGFSFPHRTLGENMLKDELFGIDFDGTSIDFNSVPNVRSGNTGALSPSTLVVAGTGTANPTQVPEFEYWIAEDRNVTSIIPAVRNDATSALEFVAVENMDSVCIDCHGDSTYYNGDDPTFLKTEGTSALPLGTYGSGEYGGWELLLKGLP